MRMVGFDLGDTLIYYPDVPLSWHTLYREALSAVARRCNCKATDDAIAAGESILSRYNTRLNPRDEEVTSEEIFGQILARWGIPPEGYLDTACRTFFEFFQRNSAVFPDTIPTLEYLKGKGVTIGVLTDLPYGMPKDLIERDVAPIAEYIDVLVTSTQVGFRKPRPEGYLKLASEMKTEPRNMIYVGDEPKDIIGANNVGMFSVLLDRNGGKSGYGEKLRISSLSQLLAIL